jgi:nitrite reductase/ring-hydroxylating ferredoxin subunit
MRQESVTEVDGSEPTATGSTRRGVLAGVGLVGVAGVVAACGGGSDDADAGGGTDTGGEAGAGGVTAGAAFAQVSDVPVGGAKFFKDQKVIVSQPTAGTFEGFSSVCTHRGCDVSEVKDGALVCPCHQSKFDLATGKRTGGPAEKDLPKKAVKVEGDSISLA